MLLRNEFRGHGRADARGFVTNVGVRSNSFDEVILRSFKSLKKGSTVLQESIVKFCGKKWRMGFDGFSIPGFRLIISKKSFLMKVEA